MQRPNILFLFSDQHAADVLGCEGHDDVLTPNLDALAQGGTRLRRAYCQDGVCVPSRLSLMTGQYPRSLGVLENRDHFRGEVAPLAAVLGGSGYRCAAFGKRHLRPVGSAVDSGWHEQASSLAVESPGDNYPACLDQRGLLETFAPDWGAEWAQGPHGSRLAGQPYPYTLFSLRPTELPEDATMEAWVAQRTIEFLRRQKHKPEPFFCWSSFYRPHQPYTPHPKYLGLYDASDWGPGRRHGGAIRMPPTLRQDPSTLPPGLRQWFEGKNRVWRLDLARQDEQIYRDYVAAYYALVSEIDACVGQILQALEDLGLRENTLIIYSADHGDFVARHGMVEKNASGQNIYEETLRVPLIFNWPGRIRAAQAPSDLVELVDIYPTLLDMAGVEPPAVPSPAGESLRGLLTEGKHLRRRLAVSESWYQTTAITQRYKLGRWNGSAEPEVLFDRQEDPLELRNLAGTPGMEEVAADLRAQLAQWERQVPDRRFPRQKVGKAEP